MVGSVNIGLVNVPAERSPRAGSIALDVSDGLPERPVQRRQAHEIWTSRLCKVLL